MGHRQLGFTRSVVLLTRERGLGEEELALAGFSEVNSYDDKVKHGNFPIAIDIS